MRMSFMQPQLHGFQLWDIFEGADGTTVYPAGYVSPEDIRGYTSHETLAGYGVRRSAPGYLDSTDFTYYATQDEALEAYREMQEEDAEEFD
jgi:hypothetical protein